MGLQFEEFKEEAKVVWERQEEDRIEGEKNQRGSDVENRDRMVRMREDKDRYLDSLLKERKNVFEKKITEFNDLMADERKTRLERRRKWMREREEEEQTKKDELAIKEREEREAREAIEKEKEKEEYEKKKAELEEVERKKREKEREIEERMEERRRKWMREREEEEQTKKDELAIKER